MSSELPTTSTLRLAAMSLLSRREHSAGELKKKLSQKYGVENLVIEAVDRLTEQNLQNDERFTEAFVGMRQRQGKGSVLIKMELREKCVAPALIDHYVNEYDPIWVQLAQQAYRKRFGSIENLGAQEKAKRMRFLHSRGFAAQHIQHVFQALQSEDFE